MRPPKEPEDVLTPRFDSATSLLLALASHLHGREYKGFVGPAAALLGSLLNQLPEPARKWLYRSSGGWDAIPARRAREVSISRMCEWAAGQYPARPYPAVMIGSANGAAAHLCAALGIPWLPQTFLFAMRRRLEPGRGGPDFAWGRPVAEEMLRRNPGLHAHQMHDPVQDRLMVARMAYFRLKAGRLEPAYREFLSRHLPRGGRILVLDCGLKWRVSRAGTAAHYFQFGGHGGCRLEEYLNGGPRVEEFLRREGPLPHLWEPPPVNGEAPEAEWGFREEMLDDLRPLAKERGWRIGRFSFHMPQDFSPFTAAIYEKWHAARDWKGPRRLVLPCFALTEPKRIADSGSVPFWLMFNTEPALDAAVSYLEGTAPFDEIYLILISNGVRNIGLIPVEAWHDRLLSRARRRAKILGTDETKFPTDLASFARYLRALRKEIPRPETPPAPLKMEELDEWLKAGSKFVRYTEE